MASRVRSWFARHPPSCCLLFLEAMVKVLNALAAAAGLIMLGVAADMALQLQQGGIEPVPQPPLGGGTISPAAWPWFVWAFGAAGLVTFGTGLLALAATLIRSITCSNVGIISQCIVLVGQAGVAFASYNDHSWPAELPRIAGKKQLLAALRQRLVLCQWGALGIVGLQVLVLALGCMLQDVYVRAEQREEDREEDESFRTRPLIDDAQRAHRDPVSLPAPRTRRDPWSRKMKDRYGLDTSRFTYNPEALPDAEQAALEPELPQSSSKCIVQ